MRKSVVISVITFALLSTGLSTANAHVEVQLRGYSNKAGDESQIVLRAEHGCMHNNAMYATEQLQLQVPNAAGRPKPGFLPGFVASVVDSKTKDSKGIPVSYTVTWKAKNSTSAIDGNSFFEVGLLTTWSSTPQKIFIPATQTCTVTKTPSSGMGAMTMNAKDVGKKLYLKWTVTTGATPKNTADTEYGPAAEITTVK